MEVIFWFSLALVVYVYAGYPVLLRIAAAVSGRRVFKRPIEPDVTVVIATRDDAATIQRRLGNILALDYPPEKLQVVVSLDGAAAATEELLRRIYGSVEVLRSEVPKGKAAAINAAMRRASGEIVVFADARQTFDGRAIRELVTNFADHRVGAVSGQLVILDDSGAESRDAAGMYWRYEKGIRDLEARLHSVIGATGAIYAIRRELFRPLPEDTILDDVMIPMRIVLAGKRVVTEPAAVAFDRASCCAVAEFSRKVRTLAGNCQLISRMPELLVPLRNPVAWQFLSHKTGRLFTPFAMALLFISNAFLVYEPVYALAFGIQSLWYALALVGHVEYLRESGETVVTIEERRRAA